MRVTLGIEATDDVSAAVERQGSAKLAPIAKSAAAALKKLHRAFINDNLRGWARLALFHTGTPRRLGFAYEVYAIS